VLHDVLGIRIWKTTIKCAQRRLRQ
jgi:hypothetical protein